MRTPEGNKIFWTKVNRVMQGKQGHDKPMIDEDGTVISDPSSICDKFRSHLLRQSQDSIAVPERRPDIPPPCSSVSADESKALLTPFTLSELNYVINDAVCGKSPGPDRFPNEIIKRAGPSFRKAFLRVCNQILVEKAWPRRWKVGNVVMLHKKGASSSFDNYRPITLLPCMSKIFERLLLSRISNLFERHNCLSDYQNGFRPERDTVQHVLLLHEVIAHAREKRQTLYCASIDVRKAYDTVWRDLLWDKLRSFGLPEHLVVLIKSMYTDASSRVRIRNILSLPFSTVCGVAQGGVLSPLLYDIFINEIAQILTDPLKAYGSSIGSQRISIILFADDIFIIASSPVQLQSMLDDLTAFATSHRFRFSPSKCSAIAFGSAVDGWHPSLAGHNIQIVDRVEYLGVIFQSTLQGRWNPTANRLMAKASKLSQWLKTLFKRKVSTRVSTMVYIWKTKVRPVVEYAAGIWYPFL